MLDLFSVTKTSIRGQSKWVRRWPAAWPFDTPLMICTGNHDWWPMPEHVVDNDAEGGWLQKAKRNGQVQVDAQSTRLLGHTFVSVRWNKIPSLPSSPDPYVVLLHSSPLMEGSLRIADRNALNLCAEMALVPKLENSMLLVGHDHAPFRFAINLLGTWCFNPGVGELNAPMPNYISIDTVRKVAVISGTILGQIPESREVNLGLEGHGF